MRRPGRLLRDDAVAAAGAGAGAAGVDASFAPAAFAGADALAAADFVAPLGGAVGGACFEAAGGGTGAEAGAGETAVLPPPPRRADVIVVLSCCTGRRVFKWSGLSEVLRVVAELRSESSELSASSKASAARARLGSACSPPDESERLLAPPPCAPPPGAAPAPGASTPAITAFQLLSSSAAAFWTARLGDLRSLLTAFPTPELWSTLTVIGSQWST